MDISNLRSFMSGDAIYLLSVVCGLFVFNYWKAGEMLKIFTTLIIYAIIAVLLKGNEMLHFLSGILKWFGIDVGF